MINSYVHVITGKTRGGIEVVNASYKLLEGPKLDKDGMYITVEGNGKDNLRNGRNRVYMDGVHCYRPTDGATLAAPVEDEIPESTKTDEEIAAELRETFEILGEMTKAVASDIVRGVVVSGGAGVGKSKTVTDTLEENLALVAALRGSDPCYEVISGYMTASILYEKLYNFKDAGNVLVFDDCDNLLYDEDTLNILKAALDSKKKRTISWNTRSLALERADIPNSFEYQGGIIFITNVDFNNVRSPRIKNHLEAIVSRCHYMDIGIKTMREKIIHIKNIALNTTMLDHYNFNKKERAEVVDYVVDNAPKLRDLSLRMVLKVADLRKAMPTNWTRFAEKNCHK
jgi:hypothetical protein